MIYDRLLGRMPVVMSRTGFTLVEPRTAKLLERYHHHSDPNLRGRGFVEGRVAHALVPDSVGARLRRSLDWAVTRHPGQIWGRNSTDSITRSRPRWQQPRARFSINSKKCGRRPLRKPCAATRRRPPTRSISAGSCTLTVTCRSDSIRFFRSSRATGSIWWIQLYDAVRLDCPDHRIFTI